MLHLDTISIEKVSFKNLLKAEKFLFEQCKLHYGNKITPLRYEELRLRLQKEMQRDDHAMFIAQTRDEKVVGCITLSCYDDRIDAIKGRYAKGSALEVSRCYVDNNYRRRGIGSLLFDKVCAFAKELDYEMLYLHTHYFLPGGFNFWNAVGFTITLEEGGSWQTVHMERYVEEEAVCYA
ncbi:GNAT family N-acetyltransferase [Sulfurospirillum arcachonense]|uniref:GNAT family N-acetyltransferase n=1 Tax=Sulfurospirillum arcachonense TaxID=57666 RepID=UPI00046A34B6|nr:GNAT family N-acetyltransferase [Sulfurospirillum arcachonense]